MEESVFLREVCQLAAAEYGRIKAGGDRNIEIVTRKEKTGARVGSVDRWISFYRFVLECRTGSRSSKARGENSSSCMIAANSPSNRPIFMQ